MDVKAPATIPYLEAYYIRQVAELDDISPLVAELRTYDEASQQDAEAPALRYGCG